MADVIKRFHVRRWDSFWNDWTMIPVDFETETEAEKYAEERTIENGTYYDGDIDDITDEYQVWALSADGFYAVCRSIYWLANYGCTGKLTVEHMNII